MFKNILMLFFVLSISVFAEEQVGSGEVDNYQDTLKAIEESTKEESEMRNRLDKTNKEIINTAERLLKTLNRQNAPNLVLEDKDGNKTIVRVDEDTKQIIITSLSNKTLTPKDETIDTSTNIKTAEPHSLNNIIYVMSGILYVFASAYLLAVAVGKALSGGYTLLVIDFIIWLFLTSLMAKILGYL